MRRAGRSSDVTPAGPESGGGVVAGCDRGGGTGGESPEIASPVPPAPQAATEQAGTDGAEPMPVSHYRSGHRDAHLDNPRRHTCVPVPISSCVSSSLHTTHADTMCNIKK